MQVFSIQDIRDALSIEQVLETHGFHLRSGRGPCPVCGTSERSTSFATRDGRWRCFACNERGDVVDLVAKLDQVPLREAIRSSAGLAGIIPGAHPVQVHPRPKSAWQIAREARDVAWWRFVAARRERKRVQSRLASAVRRFGPDHDAVSGLEVMIAEAYDREFLAEYAYERATEAMR